MDVPIIKEKGDIQDCGNYRVSLLPCQTLHKALYDKAMLPTLLVEAVCSAGVLERIIGKLDDLKQAVRIRT